MIMAAAFPHAGNRAAVALHRAGGIYRVVLPGEQLPAFHPPPPSRGFLAILYIQ